VEAFDVVEHITSGVGHRQIAAAVHTFALEHAEAAWHLGQEYTIGTPVGRNLEEAVRWYRVAADLGYASAQESLGNAYAEGIGIQQDLEAATYWLELAAANPNRFLDPDDGDTKAT